jgi:predicted negative regulator of RcsB-dependent stress response
VKLPHLLSERYGLGRPRSSAWHTASLIALAVTLAVLPWATWPSAGDRFELPKLIVLALGVGFAFVTWLTGVVAERVVNLPASPTFGATVGVLVALALSGIVSGHFPSSVFGVSGTWAESTLAQLGFLLLALLLAVQLTSIDAVKRFGIVFAFSTGLLALTSLFHLRGIRFIPPLPAASFTFLSGTPQPLAVIAALGVTLAVFFALRGVEHISRRVRWALVMVVAVLLLTLEVKVGFGLAIIGLVLLLVPVWGRPGAFPAAAFVVPSAAIGVAVLALLLLPLKGGPSTLSPVDSATIAVSTLTSPRAATGIGPALFPIAFDRFRPAAYNRSPAWQIRPIAAGSAVTDRAASQGILGLTAFLLLAVTLLVSLWRRALAMDWRRPEYAVLAPLAIGLSLLTVSAFLTPWTAALHFYFWLFVGFGLAAVASRRVALSLDVGWAAAMLRAALPVASVVVLLVFVGWLRTAWGDHLLGRARAEVRSASDLTGVRTLLARAGSANPIDSQAPALSAQAEIVQAQVKAGSSGSPSPADVASAVAKAKDAARRMPLAPENVENLLAIVRSYGGLPEDEVEDWFRTLTRLDPANPAVFVEYGQFLYSVSGSATASEGRTAKLTRARDAFQRAAALKPDLPEARYGAALAFSALGQNAEAAALLKDLTRELPNVPVVALEYARVLIAQKEFATAVEILEPVSKSASGNAQVALLYGEALVGAERKADARSVLEAALKENPDSVDLKDAIGKL